MLIRRRKHTVPSLNTTSTADISFMLLIFFLVTSSMDVDRGLVRQLPPLDDTEDQSEATDVSRDNTMAFRITADSRVLLDGNPVATDGLRKRIGRFVGSRPKQHVITIDCDPQAGYDSYFHLQNEIVAAYNTLRDEAAMRIFHRHYAECTDGQKKTIAELCPQHIAETYNSPAAANAANGEGGMQ